MSKTRKKPLGFFLVSIYCYNAGKLKICYPCLPCRSEDNPPLGRWVASLLLLCFQHPHRRKRCGRPAIHSKSIRHPLSVMWV